MSLSHKKKEELIEASTNFIFDISKQVKQFYETPVIFLTFKDYSDDLFNSMCTLRVALQNESKTDIIDVVVDFHLKWLNAINEIEQFQKRINDVTKEEIVEAINYTLDALCARHKYYQRYIAKYTDSFSNENIFKANTDREIVEEMHKEITKYLLEKSECFKNFDSDDSFKVKKKDAIEDLFYWVDYINDSVSMLLCKYINVHLPHIGDDLPKTLHQIVDDLKKSNSPRCKNLLKDFKEKGKQLEMMIRCTAEHSLEMAKLVEKINKLEDRISRLQNEPSSAALMALYNKKEYLENTLSRLDNSKITLEDLYKSIDIKLEDQEVTDKGVCTCNDFFQLRIFNHELPTSEREHLVTELCRVWNQAIFGECNKSMISIFSAAAGKDEYTDNFGTYYIDEYSRKIYKIPGDETFYQVNDQGKLVPVSDNSKHIYFYDECGRYYIDEKSRFRIYKSHENASEYMLDNSGTLMKIREERDGVVYYYDNFGRYYINDEGKNIYREEDTISEYENDGFGNLVRLRSHLDIFDPCPSDTHVTEDSKYLQKTVGMALRQCIAEVILHQPVDPIKYLSECLLKYKKNIECKENELKEKEEFELEREIRIAEERAAMQELEHVGSLIAGGESDDSYDSNLVNYTTAEIDELTSEKTN